MPPRVTLGVATYERDTYLAEAVASCLRQTYDDLEVLVVLDGGSNPNIERVLAALRRSTPARRAPRVNRGIAEAYNTIIREGRGELIAMLGDDDVCEPDRIAPPGRGLRPPPRHRRGPRRGVDHRRPGRAARHVAEPGPRPPRAAAPSGARAQHARRPVAHGPPPRLRGRRRLQQRLPPRPGLRLLAARGARLPLPRRARRPAHRPAPPRRQLLRRVRRRPSRSRRCRTRCAR